MNKTLTRLGQWRYCLRGYPQAYVVFAPREQVSLEKLVSVSGHRWQIEQCFQMAKGECELDQLVSSYYPIIINTRSIGCNTEISSKKMPLSEYPGHCLSWENG
ncbi:MAG: hypothetical protein ACMZI2_06750 [Candidatus Symbiodolus clandestinus]